MALRVRDQLIEMMDRYMPRFEHLRDETPGYWFRRAPVHRLFAIVVIQSSQKHNCLSVDVASTFFPKWDRQYGHHQMRTSTGLPNLRLASDSIPMEEDYYSYDGTEEAFRASVHRIGYELSAYGTRFLDQRNDEVANDPVLNAGLEWLESRHLDLPSPVFVERERSVLGHSVRVRTVEHPILEELKEFLRRVCDRVDASKRQRKETAVLALDLLAYAEAGLL